MGHFGEAVLAEAVNNLTARDYQPPVAESDSTARSCGQHNTAADGVPAEAITMLDAICEPALALGWKRERLYGTGNGRIFSQNHGLVSFLKPGDRIVESRMARQIGVGQPTATDGKVANHVHQVSTLELRQLVSQDVGAGFHLLRHVLVKVWVRHPLRQFLARPIYAGVGLEPGDFFRLHYTIGGD